jgi:hypothetical protein
MEQPFVVIAETNLNTLINKDGQDIQDKNGKSFLFYPKTFILFILSILLIRL